MRVLNDDLVRGVATIRARATLACHSGYVHYYYSTTPLKMKLIVNENIIIDSIDEEEQKK